MMADGIGQVNFFQSIISYISLFTCLGCLLYTSGMPNIITGLILALGRVSGETAPILFTCAAYFLPQLDVYKRQLPKGKG